MSASSAAAVTPNNGFAPLINEQYRIAKRLGGGSFGDIYLGVGQNGERVAVKFEKHTTRCPQLRHEYKVYRELQKCPGFGKVHYFGTHNSYNAMVMDLLGPSLEDQFTKCGRRFSLKTVLQIADQLLERMEAMHARHLIHRDVKPANFVLGPGRGCQTVFCIDFGLSTRYRHPTTLQHIPYRDGRSLTGTPRYASINNHLGIEQSRRDDLESIGQVSTRLYVLVYFLKGSLPWQGLKARNAKRKYKMILEKKQSISIQQLCQGLPQQFAEYLAYCRSLKFEAKPNMSYLQGLLHDLYKSQGYTSTGPLEWDWVNSDGAATLGARAKNEGGEPHEMATPADKVQDAVSSPTPGEKKTTKTQVSILLWSDSMQRHMRGPGVHIAYPSPQEIYFSPFDVQDEKYAKDGGYGEQGPALGVQSSQSQMLNRNRSGGASGVDGSGISQCPGTGGWSMWNLRPKTSGSFWGGRRGWQPQDATGGRSAVEGVSSRYTRTATANSADADHQVGKKMLKGDPSALETKRGTRALPGSGSGGDTTGSSRLVSVRDARPHTAHTLRGGETREEKGGGPGGAPIVAGARGMMR
ncbi:unnamed protein product [Choristocarpus tenellus]